MTVIVPNLPPNVDGLGDYGFNLGQQIYQNWGWKTHFIVGNPDWRGTSEGEFFRVTPLAARSPVALMQQLPATPAIVLLHYAGHGYAPRGCPTWLVQSLRKWKQPERQLITFFHELYATSPLLSSAIITSPLQKRLAIQLMRLSDRVLTSREGYAAKIQRFSPHREVGTFAVFSSVGELSNPRLLAQRSRRLVVFGGRETRLRLYQRSPQALYKICRELEIREIVDIGPRLKLDPLPDISVQWLGVQPAAEVSRYLGDAIAGMVEYPANYLGKSSIFASYCAHGVIPIVVSSRRPSEDGIAAGRHYWRADSSQVLNLETGQAIAAAAYTWYQGHNLPTQAQSLATWLNDSAIAHRECQPIE